MKQKIFGFIIVVIVAIFSFFQTGCTTQVKPVKVTEIKTPIILPTPVRPMVLQDTTYITSNGLVCLSPTDYIKETKNLNEIYRYNQQLINENKTLRSIISGD